MRSASASHAGTTRRRAARTARSSASSSSSHSAGPNHGGRQPRGQTHERDIGQAHEPRSQKRRRPQLGDWIGQIAQQGEDVFDFVGVEEAQALVHVAGNAALLEGALKGLMSVARAKQDRDVAGCRPPGDACLAIAHDAAGYHARDLVGHGGGL